MATQSASTTSDMSLSKQRSKAKIQKEEFFWLEPAGSVRRNLGVIGNNEEKREKGTGNEGSSVRAEDGENDDVFRSWSISLVWYQTFVSQKSL
jgi:hypothetical protein